MCSYVLKITRQPQVVS